MAFSYGADIVENPYKYSRSGSSLRTETPLEATFSKTMTPNQMYRFLVMCANKQTNKQTGVITMIFELRLIRKLKCLNYHDIITKTLKKTFCTLSWRHSTESAM